MLDEIKSKKAAIELSIGTVVIIVLAMSMLVLGIALVRNIFKGATSSVDILNDRVVGEITSLFADEGSDVIVKLGADQTAKIKQGSGPFRIAIGARKSGESGGTQVTRDDITYTLKLDDSEGNCVKKYGNTIKSVFVTPLDVSKKFDRIQGSQVFALIELNVKDSTPICTQKVYIDVNIRDDPGPYGNFFIIEVQKKGFL